MTTEQQQRLQVLLNEITRPIFIWRMAGAMIPSGNPSQAAGAAKRRDAALAEIDEKIMSYARSRKTPREEYGDATA